MQPTNTLGLQIIIQDTGLILITAFKLFFKLRIVIQLFSSIYIMILDPCWTLSWRVNRQKVICLFSSLSLEIADTQDKNSNLQKGKVVWEQDSSSFDHLVINLKQKTQQWSSMFILPHYNVTTHLCYIISTQTT